MMNSILAQVLCRQEPALEPLDNINSCNYMRESLCETDQTSLRFALNAGDAPRWVFFLGGFAVFAYLHLDCVDGKQARRTKSSSPLGQLFDHGTSNLHCSFY